MDDLHSSASDDSRSDAILTVTGTFLTISAVSVSLRCFVRTRLVRAFGWDDSLMVLAMSGSWFLSILNLGFAICGIAGSHYGMGRKLGYFALRPDNFQRAHLCWWLGQILYVLTSVVAKISIMLTLLRVTIERIHAWILYAAMSLATVIGLIFLFFTIFECTPADYFWNRLSERGTCIDRNTILAIAYLYSIGATITDLTIGLLPVVVMWDMRMDRR